MTDSPTERALATQRARANQAPPGGRSASGPPAFILLLGASGGLLLVLTELTTIASVDIPGRTCREIADLGAVKRCELSGFERHGGALLLLGALAVVMTIGAGRARSRPAAAALIAIAAVALGIALLRDLPEAGKTGAIGITYEGADGRAGTGLYLEIAGGLLLGAAGALALVNRPGGPTSFESGGGEEPRWRR